MDLKEEARALVRNLRQRMSPSSYDIAWMARLRNTTNGDARWPDLIEWLLENQHPDGCWGGGTTYYHDRVICTLAAAIALHENGHNQQTEKALKCAEHYLWHHLHLLPHDPFELSGFELILPTLLNEARSLGLDVPAHICGYEKIQTAKLRLIPLEMLYSPHISTIYSLEFLGRAGDPDRLWQAVASNGSLGDSPATTAYYLLACNYSDERALAYLEAVRAQNRIVTVYPFHIFELGWVLNNLSLSGLPIAEFADQSITGALYSEMGSTGFALDPTFGVTDGDITSVCCRVLLSAGYDIDPLILAHFEDKESRIFHTYEYERNISISTNIHAFDALSLMPHYPDWHDVREQIVITLLDNRKYNTYWVDKWHASPYYATAHALIALMREDFSLAYACRYTFGWLLHTQHEDGSWGFFQRGTAEETAYVLTALLHYNRYEPVDPDVLHRGAAYLSRMYRGADSIYTELWLAKSVYAPYDIIRSAILAAMILYEGNFGRPPG